MSASTFSYAQAAKGLSTPTAPSKPTSGAATPAKPVPAPASANGSVGPVPSWADEAESEVPTEKSDSTVRAAPRQAPVSTPAQPTACVDASSISSPDLGASSVSTAPKDDDVSSLPNASSEITSSSSTWDNKSQASASVDKPAEPVEKTSEKVSKGKNVHSKPLQEAPLPAVNVWKMRQEVAQQSKAPKPTSAPLTNGASTNNAGAPAKKSESRSKAQPTISGAGRARGRDDEKYAHVRKDADSSKDSRNKVSEKDGKPAAAAQLPPPKRDQEAWPTPETVINEDRKKAQEKGDQEQKEQKDSTSSGGKHAWKKMEITPSVVFSTPLPNAANTRRGGRAGGRGGSQPGGRSTTYGANGAGQPEKEGPASAPVTNGDHTKRERIEGVAPQDASPKSKRTGSAASPTLKDQVPAAAAEKSSSIAPPPGSENDFRPRTASSAPDSSQAFGQGNTHSRQFPTRAGKPRRGDMSFTGERRRDGDSSPIKDNAFDDRRTSAATQTDMSGEGERRSTYHDGTNGHSGKAARYAYANARERGGRGGGRGGRGSYTNGYPNGHMPTQSSSSFTIGPRSPTTFNPENSSFFSGKYGRNGHRSQSVTTDPYRFAPYQAGPPVAPLQPYGGVYDYSMMPQPMSAMSYAPYVDQFALFSMITAQLEYYFSVDNLLKDMYLRRRMDSQGFVSLEFIAGFNRIKQLSADIELIKLVCQQSNVVEYRTGEDGQDRLRRREGWQQWVLNMADRDAVAQNEGPKELRHPMVSPPTGFDPSNAPEWSMSAVEPPAHYGNNAEFPQMNGYSHGGAQDGVVTTENLNNGTTSDGSCNGAVANGHPVEASTKA